MNPFIDKRNSKKENQFKPIKNKIINYPNNTNNQKYYSSSNHTYNKLDPNEDINNKYNNNLNKYSERQSFNSVKEQSNTNENINFFENKIIDQYNNDYFNNFKYYETPLSFYNSLPIPENNQQSNDNMNDKNNLNIIIHKECTKYNPNYFNQGKKNNIKKEDKNLLTINTHNSFTQKKTINVINNSKYGELSKKIFKWKKIFIKIL